MSFTWAISITNEACEADMPKPNRRAVHCGECVKLRSEMAQYKQALTLAEAHCPAQPTDSNLSMYAVIDNMEGRLPAQLTAAACVMRLCLSEIKQKEELGKQTSTGDMGPYCLRALNEGWFGGIVRVMRLAIEVILRAWHGMVIMYVIVPCFLAWLCSAAQAMLHCCHA